MPPTSFDQSQTLKAFIKTAQYFVSLPDDADIWVEASEVLRNFFSADIAFFALRRSDGAVPRQICHCPDAAFCHQVFQKTIPAITEVLDSGFLATESLTLGATYAMLFLPVTFQSQSIAVMIVGHRATAPLAKELIDVYLAVASQVGTIVAKQTSEARLRTMTDNVPAMIFHAVANRKEQLQFVYASKGASTVLGCLPEDLLNDPRLFLARMDAADRETLHTAISEAGSSGQRFNCTVRWNPQPDERRYIQIYGRATPAPNGSIQVDGAAQDITAQTLAGEERLRLATAIEQAAESIVITDRHGTILYVNPCFEQTSGYSREEAIGQTPRILKSGRHDRGFYKAMWHTITNGMVWHGHLINRKKDGTIFEEDATISPIQDERGEIGNFVAVKRDVTEQMRLAAQLRQAQKMEALGTLAGGIAHDFNNILTAILGYADMALDKSQEGSVQRSDLGEVLKAANRARELVKQILAFSRQTELEHIPVQPDLIIKEVSKLLRASLPATIEIRQNLAPHCGAVLADPTQLHQVLMNLCTNAYHAMRPAGGVLSLSLAQTEIAPGDTTAELGLLPGSYLRLEVSDTGHGMEKAVLERIFDPYFTTKQKGDGTGLGLAVVHGIVKSIHGHIAVASEPGRGTTFQVYLPKVETAASPTEAAVAPGGNEHILVVDDEETIVRLLTAILRALGYHVTTTTSSPEALRLFNADPDRFDLVITDMTMPEMTGAQLAQQLIRSRPELPIILCSGFSELINEEKAAAIGIRAYIMKPVLRTELATTIRSVLAKKD